MPYPAAERWDLAAKDYLLDVDGRHVSEHPVDASVTLCLGWRRGTIAGDPETGHTLHLANMGATDAVLARDIRERQQASIQWLIDRGLVELVSVQHEVDPYGRLSVLTKYRNLVTGKPGEVIAGG